MFEFFLSAMFLTPTGSVDTWSDADRAYNQSRATRVHMEIAGRTGADCRPPAITLPPSRGRVLRFEQGGVRYEGTEAESGHLVVRSGGTRPVTLTGNRANGGLWSLGNDGKCVGTWRPEG
jgi:hypothetical protein